MFEQSNWKNDFLLIYTDILATSIIFLFSHSRGYYSIYLLVEQLHITAEEIMTHFTETETNACIFTMGGLVSSTAWRRALQAISIQARLNISGLSITQLDSRHHLRYYTVWRVFALRMCTASTANIIHTHCLQLQIQTSQCEVCCN